MPRSRNAAPRVVLDELRGAWREMRGPLSLPGFSLVRRPDALLIDLDGVLYVEDTPISGAVEAVAELRALGLPMR